MSCNCGKRKIVDIYKMIQDTDKKAWAKGKILQLLFAIEKNLQNG